jgi:arylsulfatase A-like enzyme
MIRYCALATFVAFGPPVRAADSPPPNVLVIVADDLGWNDVGYHGSDTKTPTIDRLAKEGVALERYYVYPTCSPTRCGILTGRNPSRFRIAAPISGRSEDALPKDTMTLGRALQQKGYETALFGKWHLGLTLEFGPKKYGFDRTYGYLHGQLDQYTHRYKNGDRTWHRDDVFVDEEGHATDLIAGEAIKFIGAKRTRPFFLYLAFSVPHYPLQEEDRWTAPYRDSIKIESRRLNAASVTHMDDAIGKVVEALRKSGQLENTLIVFTSDNGGQKDYASKTDYGGKHGPYPVLGDNRPYRGWKTELYEGGIRVPGFIYWKGKLGKNTVSRTVSLYDWFPTIAKLAGVEIKPEWKLEGRDVWPLLSGTGQPPADPVLYWSIGREKAVMDGDWKLIVPRAKGANPELYNIADDPFEKKNVAADKPDVVAALRKKLEEQAKTDP